MYENQGRTAIKSGVYRLRTFSQIHADNDNK